MSTSVFILAGGKSSRMGSDKASLQLGGTTLLERMRELASAIAEPRVVGPKLKHGPDSIEDVHQDHGPLAGIHAALTASASELNLILSVDMPFVTPEFLGFLVTEAKQSGATVTVPYIEERYQPLCAVYRRNFLALAEPSLRVGKNKIDPLFCHTTVRRIDEQELKRLAFDPRMFDNLNTPEDYAKALNR